MTITWKRTMQGLRTVYEGRSGGAVVSEIWLTYRPGGRLGQLGNIPVYWVRGGGNYAKLKDAKAAAERELARAS